MKVGGVMKFAKIPRYVRHGAYRDPANGHPGVHAMKRGPTAVVDVRAFLNAELAFDDALYPDEPGGAAGGNALITATFAKGGTCFYIDTQASELARVLGRDSIPEEWLGRHGRDALEPRV